MSIPLSKGFSERFNAEMDSIRNMVRCAASHANHGDQKSALDWLKRLNRRTEWLIEHFEQSAA